MKSYTTLDEVEEVVEKKSFIIDTAYINNYNRILLIEKLFTYCCIVLFIVFTVVTILEAVKITNILHSLTSQEFYNCKFIPLMVLFYISFPIFFSAIKIYFSILKKKTINECFKMKYYICINELKRFNNYDYLKEDEIEKILNQRIYKAADIVVK